LIPFLFSQRKKRRGEKKKEKRKGGKDPQSKSSTFSVISIILSGGGGGGGGDRGGPRTFSRKSSYSPATAWGKGGKRKRREGVDDFKRHIETSRVGLLLFDRRGKEEKRKKGGGERVRMPYIYLPHIKTSLRGKRDRGKRRRGRRGEG